MTVLIDIGTLRQVATLWQPGTPVPDGDGGFTVQYAQLDPATWRCAIVSASASVSQHHFAETVIAQASNVMMGRYHPDIQPGTRVVWVDRTGVTHTADVLGVEDVEGAGVQTIAIVSEVVGAAAPVEAPSWIQEGWAQ
jgi:plastocyanin